MMNCSVPSVSVVNLSRWAALLAIVLLAFVLRVARVGELRMWGDEAFSVYSAHRTLAAITFEGIENDPHPPLYYYLLHFYLPLAGSSELALRFFSVCFGVATIPLLYVIGKKMFDARVGILAAAFAAIAPFHVYYSQEIRMYALAIFLTTLALYFFVRLLASDESRVTGAEWRVASDGCRENAASHVTRHASHRWLWLGYALTMFLALHSLYHTAFVFLAEGIFLLPLFKTRRAFVLRWLAVACGVVVAFLPWLLFRFPSTVGHLESRAGSAAPQDLPTFVARGFAALTVGMTIPPTTALLLAALFFALIVVGLFLARKPHAPSELRITHYALRITHYDGLLLTLLIIPLLAVYPLYLLLPIFVGRLFALAFVPLTLLLARSLRLIAPRARAAAIVFALLIVAASAYSLNDYYWRFSRYSAAAEDYIPVIRAVEQRAQSGDVVLFHAYWQEGYFLSHYRGAAVEYRALDVPRDLDTAVAQPRNLWAIVQGLPFHPAETWLAQHAFPIGEQKFGQMRVLSYRAGVPARAEKFATPVIFNNGIALLGYRLNDTPLESGRGIVTIQLDWQATQKIADDFTVSVRLTSLRGKTVWAQEDSQPAGGTLPTSGWQVGQVVQDRRAFVIPVGTPPGEYAIQIVMYHSQSSRAANIVAPENLRAQSLTLGNISITKPAIVLPAPPIPHALDARWNEIALAGFARGADEILPGDALLLTLYWQARQKPARDYLAAIKVVDASGVVRASARYRPANAAFPTRAWDAGETWLDQIALTIDAEAASGDATVWVNLVDAASGEVLTPRAVELTRVQIAGRAHRFELPSPQNMAQIILDAKIKLLGYDLDAKTYRPGAAMALTLYWQAFDKMDQRYTVFAHVLDATGVLVAQKDGEPDAGRAPTTSWLRGEVITDVHHIELPQNLAPGEYALVVGMYQASSGTRLTTAAGADRAQLTKIVVAR